MNTKQTSRIQAITSKLAARKENLSFNVQQIGGDVLLQATNAYSESVFESYKDLLAIIGVRGGIRKISGNLANAI